MKTYETAMSERSDPYKEDGIPYEGGSYQQVPTTGLGPWYSAIRSMPDKILVCEIMSTQSPQHATELAEVVHDYLLKKSCP